MHNIQTNTQYIENNNNDDKLKSDEQVESQLQATRNLQQQIVKKPLQLSDDFQKVLFNTTETEAYCLDGTPAGLYYKNGYGSGANKLVIHFQGGGWCFGLNDKELLESCHSRAYDKTFNAYGSSKTWQKHSNEAESYFCSNKENDKIFYNWNRIYLQYCDGSGHQGYKKEVQTYNGEKLYFKGINITMTQLKWVEQNYDISQMDTFAVYGCSAGGLAVYTWLDHIKDRITKINPKIKFFGLADSGIFPIYKNLQTNDNLYENYMTKLYKFVNQESEFPEKKCRDYYQKLNQDASQCFFAENLIAFIDSPLYLMQSAYDSWALGNVLGSTCSQNDNLNACNHIEKAQIHTFHNKYKQIYKNATTLRNNRQVWMPSCVFHCALGKWEYYWFNTE
eukprot:403360614